MTDDLEPRFARPPAPASQPRERAARCRRRAPAHRRRATGTTRARSAPRWRSPSSPVPWPAGRWLAPPSRTRDTVSASAGGDDGTPRRRRRRTAPGPSSRAPARATSMPRWSQCRTARPTRGSGWWCARPLLGSAETRPLPGRRAGAGRHRRRRPHRRGDPRDARRATRPSGSPAEPTVARCGWSSPAASGRVEATFPNGSVDAADAVGRCRGAGGLCRRGPGGDRAASTTSSRSRAARPAGEEGPRQVVHRRRHRRLRDPATAGRPARRPMPEPGEPPADEEAARAEITECSPPPTTAQAVAAAARPPRAARGVARRAASGSSEEHPDYAEWAKEVYGEVDEIVFTAPDRASVRFSLVSDDPSIPAPGERIGEAVLIDGVWKVVDRDRAASSSASPGSSATTPSRGDQATSSLRRSRSIRLITLSWRTRSRSPGRRSCRASTSSPTATPSHTVPGGWPSCSAGPATPVVARPTSAPQHPAHAVGHRLGGRPRSRPGPRARRARRTSPRCRRRRRRPGTSRSSRGRSRRATPTRPPVSDSATASVQALRHRAAGRPPPPSSRRRRRTRCRRGRRAPRPPRRRAAPSTCASSSPRAVRRTLMPSMPLARKAIVGLPVVVEHPQPRVEQLGQAATRSRPTCAARG